MLAELDNGNNGGLRDVFSVEKKIRRAASSLWQYLFAFVLLSPSVAVLLTDGGISSDGLNKSDTLNVVSTSVVFATSANSTTPAFVGDTVTFWAYAVSDVGADLTFTIYFDYWLAYPAPLNPSGGFSVNVATSPGSVMVTHVYDHAGNITYPAGTAFLARMTVTDGFNTVTKGPLPVYVLGNRPPVFNYSLPSPLIVTRGVPNDLWTNISDPDNDPVLVTWDFGDGSPNGTNTTGPAADGVWVYQNHTWNPYVPPGGDPTITDIWTNMTLTLDDGKGGVNVTTYEVDIRIPRNEPPLVALNGSGKIDLGKLAFYNASAVDAEGENLNWTFDYGDGVLEVYYTAGEVGVTLWTNVTHLFASAGTYVVTVYVTDRLPGSQEFPHNVTASASTNVIINVPPGGLAEIVVIPESSLIINATTGLANGTMYIEAGDPDGDVITATWDFGDGSPGIVNISSEGVGPFRFVVEHGYSAVGQYNLTVNVSDGRVGHYFVRHVLINVTSSNRPPKVAGTGLDYPAGRGNYAEVNESVKMTLILKDPENDVLNYTVDYGDGSPLAYFSLSIYDSSGNQTLILEHAYSAYGSYTVRVNITDSILGSGNHIIYVNFTITVKAAPVSSENPWNWWDSVSLGLFLMIPVLLIAWVFASRRHQKVLDDAGMTYEQWLTRKPEIKEELKARKQD